MDADTYAELDALADAAMADYQTQASRDRALSMRQSLTDGVCRIRDVSDNAALPCVGYVWTDLGEKFPVFDLFTREQAKALTGKRVKLSIRMSARGTRYVVGMLPMPVDTSTQVWPCPRCGGMAGLHETTRLGAMSWLGERSFVYQCRTCAYQMEVGP